MHTIKCKTPELQNQTQLPFHCLGPLVTLIKVKFLDRHEHFYGNKSTSNSVSVLVFFILGQKSRTSVCVCVGC